MMDHNALKNRNTDHVNLILYGQKRNSTELFTLSKTQVSWYHICERGKLRCFMIVSIQKYF